MIALWPGIARWRPGGDSWGTLLLAAFVIGPLGFVASCAYLVLGFGAWPGELGEGTGAFFFVLLLTSAVPSFLGLPVALFLPRALDPVLRPRRREPAG